MNHEETYITIGEVAKQLKISIGMVRYYTNKGKLKSYRNEISNWRMYRQNDIDDFAKKLFIPKEETI